MLWKMLCIGFGPHDPRNRHRNVSEEAKVRSDAHEASRRNMKGGRFGLSIFEIVLASLFVLFVAGIIIWRIFFVN